MEILPREIVSVVVSHIDCGSLCKEMLVVSKWVKNAVETVHPQYYIKFANPIRTLMAIHGIQKPLYRSVWLSYEENASISSSTGGYIVLDIPSELEDEALEKGIIPRYLFETPLGVEKIENHKSFESRKFANFLIENPRYINDNLVCYFSVTRRFSHYMLYIIRHGLCSLDYLRKLGIHETFLGGHPSHPKYVRSIYESREYFEANWTALDGYYSDMNQMCFPDTISMDFFVNKALNLGGRFRRSPEMYKYHVLELIMNKCEYDWTEVSCNRIMIDGEIHKIKDYLHLILKRNFGKT